MNYVFLGSNPSSKNIDPDIPFLGTPSWPTLWEWIAKMNLDLDDCTFLNCTNRVLKSGEKLKVSEIDLAPIRLVLDQATKIFALGEFASSCLDRAGIPHFKLPHPSPRNRKLNDREFERFIINEARYYAHVDEKKGLKLIAI